MKTRERARCGKRTAVMVAVLLAGVSSAVRAAGSDGCPPAADVARTHVHATSRPAADLIDEGLRRSVTLQDLVERVEKHQAVVLVSDVPQIRRRDIQLTGALSHEVSVTGGYRVLHVEVQSRRHDLMIATVGHELQHVLEALGEPDARDLRTLYDRIGFQVRSGVFETQAAIEAGTQVRRDLERCRP